MRRDLQHKDHELQQKLAQVQLEQGTAQLMHLRVTAEAETRVLGLQE